MEGVCRSDLYTEAERRVRRAKINRIEPQRVKPLMLIGDEELGGKKRTKKEMKWDSNPSTPDPPQGSYSEPILLTPPPSPKG